MGSFNFRYMKNFPRNKRDKTYDRRVSLNRQLVDTKSYLRVQITIGEEEERLNRRERVYLAGSRNR